MHMQVSYQLNVPTETHYLIYYLSNGNSGIVGFEVGIIHVTKGFEGSE